MKKILIVTTFVAVIGAGAYLFYKNQIEKLMDMDFQFVGLSIEELTIANTTLDVKLQITSRAQIEAEISQMNLEVFLNNKIIGNIVDNKPILIPAKGYSIVDVEIQTVPYVVAGSIIDIAVDVYKAKDAELTIRGTLVVKSAFISKKIDINYSDSVKALMS